MQEYSDHGPRLAWLPVLPMLRLWMRETFLERDMKKLDENYVPKGRGEYWLDAKLRPSHIGRDTQADILQNLLQIYLHDRCTLRIASHHKLNTHRNEFDDFPAQYRVRVNNRVSESSRKLERRLAGDQASGDQWNRRHPIRSAIPSVFNVPLIHPPRGSLVQVWPAPGSIVLRSISACVSGSAPKRSLGVLGHFFRIPGPWPVFWRGYCGRNRHRECLLPLLRLRAARRDTSRPCPEVPTSAPSHPRPARLDSVSAPRSLVHRLILSTPRPPSP